MSHAACAVLLLCGLLLCPGLAQTLEMSGQLNALGIEAEDTRGQRGWTALTRLRLEADHQHGGWRLHLAYDHELLWGAAVRDPRFAVARSLPEPTWMDATASLHQSASLDWKHSLYRGWLQYDSDSLRLTLGRQRIAWGSGRIWNPTDRFNPVQPTALEPEQKLGVDALDVQWRYGLAGSLQAIAAPGRASRGVSRKLALRWQDTFGQTDVAVMAVGIGEERVLGLDLTGNLGDATARLEWMGSDGGSLPGFSQLVVGVDNTFYAALFPQGLYLAVEYFLNSRPGPGPDRLVSRSHQLFGLSAGYDLTPLWRAEMLAMADMERPGWFVAPALRWSMTANADLTLLAQLPGGDAASEFGPMAALYALRLDWYF